MLQRFSRRTLVTLTILANIIYIFWRIFFTVPHKAGWLALFFAIGLLVTEIVGMCELFIHFYGMTNIVLPTLPTIDDDLYPDIDVFIATYNEPVELVQKTINGCLHMLYPDPSKVHIYVCDDGTRTAMAELCHKLGVGYIVRTEHKHAKAGNLNNAMAQTSSPLIATFDADMIPRHEFLLKTVPYFLKNEQALKHGDDANHPKIGFIQTPQCFYNTDLFQFNLYAEDRIPNEQDYFYRDVQTAKNATNSAIYGGSNTVLSRAALTEVGGFFTNSITEDFATGMLIQNAGYQCYALDEALASGLSPDDLKSLIKQRERWGRGCIQTGRRLNILCLSGLTLGQKLSYLSSITYWYSSIKRFFYIVTPIMFAVFGVISVDCSVLEVLACWLPMYLLTNATIKKFSNNIRNTRWTNIYETILFQSLMLPIILETCCISQNAFSVTRKDKQKNTDKTYQLKQALPFMFYMLFSIIGVFNMLRLIFLTSSPAFFVPMFWLLCNLYNLSMVAFFLLGRDQFRKSDRFTAQIDYILHQGTLTMQGQTTDISEDGFALFYERPEYIDPAEPFDLTFAMKTDLVQYNAQMKGLVVQTQAVDGGWKYAGRITEIDTDNRDLWNQIVHDRLPSLPQQLDGTMGFYGDFQVNLHRRYAKKAIFSRKTARVTLNHAYPLPADGECMLKEFNYQYLLMSQLPGQPTPQQLSVPLVDDISLQCTKAPQQLYPHETLYHVENLPELMANTHRRARVTDALLALHQQVEQEHTAQKLEHEREEVDLMEFV